MSETKSQSHALTAQLELRALILGGALAPAERLYEVSLAERLGISRTPIREALTRLEQEGLIEKVSSGGFAVRRFTFEEVVDAIELRGVLEGTVARVAAERGVAAARLTETRALLVQLDGVMGTSPADMDFDAYVELNAQFHTLLARLPGSVLLQREVERAIKLPFASPSAFLRHQRDVPEFRKSLAGAQAQHRAIIDAIELREGARAEAIAREHARLARNNLDYILHRDRSLINRVPALALVFT